MVVNLLIIESDRFLGNGVVRRLTDENWQILLADRLSDAKKIVKRKNIDVVVLGLNTLKREGLAILKMIKKTRPLTEVIIINSSEQIALSIEGMKLGAFDDFMVPFDLDSLRLRIQDACQQKKHKEKAKKSLLDRYRDIMIAATFAEAGESDMAIEFLASRKNSEQKQIQKEINMKEIKILLVDDEEDFVKTLSERIKMRDLGSDIALNGEEALKLVDNEVPDVMVLDLKMPGIDGMEVLRRVKKAYPEVQVIMLTGHGSEKDEKDARRLGAFEYLQKPVDIDKLVQYIQRAYKNKFQSSMAAAAFAEAGEFDTARKIMDEEKDK